MKNPWVARCDKHIYIERCVRFHNNTQFGILKSRHYIEIPIHVPSDNSFITHTQNASHTKKKPQFYLLLNRHDRTKHT